MDIVLNILKQLAATLSPTEFLLVLVVIALTAFSAVRFFLKISGKKGEFNLFGGNAASLETTKIQSDIQKIEQDLTVIVNTQTELLVKLTELLGGIRDATEENTTIMREHTTDMMMFRKDVESQAQSVQKELDGILVELKMLDTHNHQMGESVKESLSKILTSTNNMLSQLEKTDEFVKAFVPEFRSYHKELGKDMTELSKDIALMERSVQTQINNTNALKLR